MANINFATREVNCKIVYYGPGRSGKTTNLEIVHQKAPKDSIGEMVSIATETDRTLFFDFLPLDLGQVAGMQTKFQLYTVPGQVYYNATRKLVLQGADGVVFVADSQKSMREENVESLQNLEENLRENGLNIDEMPLVLQWNKRDLEDIDTVEHLNEQLNRWNTKHFEAVAIRGEGVFPTLKAVASLVIKKLNQESGFTEAAAQQTAAPPAAGGAEKQAAPPPSAAPPPGATPPPPSATPPPPAAEAEPEAAPVEAPAEEAEPPAPSGGETPPPPAAAAPQPQPAAPPPAAEPKPEPAPAPQPAAEPEPEAEAAPAGGARGGEQKEESLLHRELERRRAEREERERQARERIKRSARRPVRQRDNKKVAIVGGLVLLIAAAVMVVLYFTGIVSL
jgi:small GTP-binding protein